MTPTKLAELGATSVNLSPELGAWLQQGQFSVAFTTYRANRLLLLGLSPEGQPKVHERLFDRPMGLFATGESLWMAARNQLWRLDNHLALGHSHEGGDRLYVPAVSLITGDVNAHEIVVDINNQLLFVNTAFSCIAAIEPGCSFAPTWQPPFISTLAADDRCHLNGLALKDGIPTWATACGHTDEPSGWRHNRSSGGVLIHIPTGELAATGLAMPHSPRWHNGNLYLLNSGTGELGRIEAGHFVPLCALPGFTRGLAFVGNTAIVGLSKLRSPQFTGLPLEERLTAEGNPSGGCGLRVIDLASGEILHSLDCPEPMDELFDLVVLPGVRQPRALGLQGEDIDCLVKVAGREAQVQVRPKAPSGNPHQAPRPPIFGLPSDTNEIKIRYQQVYNLTAHTLAPYASLTFPSLKRGSRALERLTGELFAVSAMAHGEMVGLAIAERITHREAALRSLCVDSTWRRMGVGTGLIERLTHIIAKEKLEQLTVQYQVTEDTDLAIEPLLNRLGWTPPTTDYVLVAGEVARLSQVSWSTKYPITDPYRLVPWGTLGLQQLAQIEGLGVPDSLRPPSQGESVDPEVSLGLLYNEELVGWIVAERLNPTSMRYSSIYISESHRGKARGPSLMVAAIHLQQQAGIPIARFAIASNQHEMLRLLKRHLNQHLSYSSLLRSSSITTI